MNISAFVARIAPIFTAFNWIKALNFEMMDGKGSKFYPRQEKRCPRKLKTDKKSKTLYAVV